MPPKAQTIEDDYPAMPSPISAYAPTEEFAVTTRPRHYITSTSQSVSELRSSDLSPREYRQMMLDNARGHDVAFSRIRTAARISGRG